MHNVCMHSAPQEAHQYHVVEVEGHTFGVQQEGHDEETKLPKQAVLEVDVYDVIIIYGYTLI